MSCDCKIEDALEFLEMATLSPESVIISRRKAKAIRKLIIELRDKDDTPL